MHIHKGSLLILAVLLFTPGSGFTKAPARTSVADAKGAKDLKPTKVEIVAIKHLDEKSGDWNVSETPHFRVFHNQSAEKVEKIAQAAERTRRVVEDKWFGDTLGEWDGKCRLSLHATRADYMAKTKQTNTLGHMRFFTSGRGISSRGIHLACDEMRLLTDVLPHEVCHSVMAHRLQGKTPRWADEGMAVLAESPTGVAGWLDLLAEFKKKRDLFSLEVLLSTEEADHIGSREYYSQSTSLVQFLTERKGPRAFIQFLRDSVRDGYGPPLKEHYGMEGVRDLERQWEKHAFAKVAGK